MIIKSLQDENVDIRTINNIKALLLNSKNRSDGNLITLSDYEEIKNQVFKGKSFKAEQLLLEEIKANDKQIDIGKLSDVIDICNHLPMVVRKVENKSSDIYCVLSSNKRENFDASARFSGGIEDPMINQSIEIIWAGLSQRFLKIADAFIFFDVDANKKISLQEFYSGLDRLKIKISD